MGFNVRKSRTAGRASGRANFFDNFYLQFDRTSRQRCVYAMYRLDQFEHDAFNWRNFVIDLIKCPSNDLPAIEPPATQPPTETTHTGSINKRKSKRRGSEREVGVRRLEARSLFAKNSCGFHCLLLNNWFLNKSCIALQSPARSRPKGLDWLRGWRLLGWEVGKLHQAKTINYK